MNVDGSEAKAFVRGRRPSWSPDGHRIVFTSNAAFDGSQDEPARTTSNIWVMEADGSQARPLTRLTNKTLSIEYAVWSPDGRKIVFLSNRALDGSDSRNTTELVYNIWAINADGSNPTPLTRFGTAGINIGALAWSPDSTRLAFPSNQALDGSDKRNPDGINVWVVKIDGSAPVPLTRFHQVSAEFGLDWSPDGSKLAFSSSGALDGSDAPNRHFTRNIWMIRANGFDAFPLTALTALGADSDFPTWSRENTIQFWSARALDGSDRVVNSENLWVMRPDGSHARALTHFTAPDKIVQTPLSLRESR